MVGGQRKNALYQSGTVLDDRLGFFSSLLWVISDSVVRLFFFSTISVHDPALANSSPRMKAFKEVIVLLDLTEMTECRS